MTRYVLLDPTLPTWSLLSGLRKYLREKTQVDPNALARTFSDAYGHSENFDGPELKSLVMRELQKLGFAGEAKLYFSWAEERELSYRAELEGAMSAVIEDVEEAAVADMVFT